MMALLVQCLFEYAMICSMAGAPRGRAQRGNGPRIQNPEARASIMMCFKVDQAVDEKVRAAMKDEKVAMCEYFQRLVRMDPVDAEGRPSWTPRIPNRAIGGPTLNFRVGSEVYKKARTAAAALEISVAEYYRQLVWRDGATHRAWAAIAAHTQTALPDLHHTETAA